jgi:hypothetical protein
MATGELETAEQVLQTARQLQARLDNQMDMAGTLANLGLALCRLGRYQEAKAHLLASLELVVKGHAYLPLIELLPAIALALAQGDTAQQIQAVTIYGMLQSQPYYANSKLFNATSGRFLQTIVHSLPTEQAQTALEQGHNKDLWAGTAELLVTLSHDWQ